jgi:hypothetical protein
MQVGAGKANGQLSYSIAPATSSSRKNLEEEIELFLGSLTTNTGAQASRNNQWLRLRGRGWCHVGADARSPGDLSSGVGNSMSTAQRTWPPNPEFEEFFPG